MRKTDQKRIIRKAIAEIFNMHSSQAHQMVYEELESMYGQPNRHHHSMEHIAEMLLHAEKFPLKEPGAFKAAILYNKIIYEPHRYGSGYKGITQEKQSALICENTLGHYDVNDDMIERASNLIQYTEKHKPPAGDDEAALLMDIDRAVLGSAFTRYQRYAQGRAKEFLAAFSEAQYLAGRGDFLREALKKPVFKTPHFEHLNDKAHKNMEWELKNLRTITYSSTYSVSPQLAL